MKEREGEEEGRGGRRGSSARVDDEVGLGGEHLADAHPAHLVVIDRKELQAIEREREVRKGEPGVEDDEREGDARRRCRARRPCSAPG